MQTQHSSSWEEQWEIWAAVAALVLVSVLAVAFGGSRERQPAPAKADGAGKGSVQIASSPETTPNLDKLSALDRYVEWIRQHEPMISQIRLQDLVDGSWAEVPSVDMRSNFVGGEATDMMAITMALDEENTRRPVPGKQEWELKTFTFPKSRATYMEIDLIEIGLRQAPAARSRMSAWKLAELCAPLESIAPEQWNQDERQYVHYLTRRGMGYNEVEVAFAALWAAYASNYSLWKGQARSVPSAAYYALAAAHFETGLASDSAPPSLRAQAVSWMLCGECHRLLGRHNDAQRCYDKATALAAQLERQAQELSGEALSKGTKVDVLKPAELQVLEMYRDLAAQNNAELVRQPFTGVPEPPIGWYVEQMLSAINGDLAVERKRWSAYRTADELCGQINAEISADRRDG